MPTMGESIEKGTGGGTNKCKDGGDHTSRNDAKMIYRRGEFFFNLFEFFLICVNF